MKKDLPTVTLLGADCVDIDRLALAAEICQKDFSFADVKLLTSLPAERVEHSAYIEPLRSTEEYSEFAISRFNDYVETSHVLIIQHDGFILNPAAWDDAFLEYDYIGAPLYINDWAIETFDLQESTKGTSPVGNGGFSLRSKKLLSLLSEMSLDNKISEYHPEDVVICIKMREELESLGIRFAPTELAEKFSFEAKTKDNYAWDGQFGFHGLRWTDISKWLEKHPEYDIVNKVDLSLI